MKKLFYLFFIYLCYPFLVFGQGEAANWYFGDGAGLRFNNDGSVTSTTDGRLNTFEGCATISDAFGDLLFYTDGIVVYDRNHNIMKNGTGLYGDSSSTQSAIIVPKPKDTNKFYIFTVDTFIPDRIDPDFGLNYSEVDMSLNDGNGEVIQKNINLLVDCSEKIAAVVKDCSNQSIWLLTFAAENPVPHDPEIRPIFNTFYAFEINTSGVVTSPIKSTIPSLSIPDHRGYLKFSSEGTKIASANIESGLYLYDFDAQTGIVSNQQEIIISDSNKGAYGIEFSPSNQYLYVHSSNNLFEEDGHSSTLLQYDISASDISNSQEVLDRSDIFRGALQLGDNGKIYRTISNSYNNGTSFLGVINNPNEKGNATNYEHNAVDLNGRIVNQGLPPFIQSFFNKINLIKNTDGTSSSILKLCEGKGFKLEAQDIPGATYSWTLDDMPIGTNTYSFEVVDAEAIDAGRYRLEIEIPSECPIIGEALIEILALPEVNMLTLIQCDVDIDNNSDGITTINLEQVITDEGLMYSFYETIIDRDADNPILDPVHYINTNPFNQTIYYKVVNDLQCEDFGEIELQVKAVDLSAKTPIRIYACDEDPDDAILSSTFDLAFYAISTYIEPRNYRFYSTIEDAVLEQDPLFEDLTTESTSIYGRMENSNQCEDIFEINLIVNPLPVFDLEPTYTVCTNNPTLTINAPDGFDVYKWFKIEGNSEREISPNNSIDILEPGNYVLEVGSIFSQNSQSNTCNSRKTFEVLPSNKAIIENIEIKDISDNNTVEILVSGDGDYEYSLDGIAYQDSPYFDNVLPGFLTAFVKDKNDCGISEKLISVVGYNKFFTPNGDGSNDKWQIIGLNSQFQANSMISIFDRYGKLVTQIDATNDGWDGMQNNQRVPESDYWFKVNLQDGREFKGHFALKR